MRCRLVSAAQAVHRPTRTKKRQARAIILDVVEGALATSPDLASSFLHEIARRLDFEAGIHLSHGNAPRAERLSVRAVELRGSGL